MISDVTERFVGDNGLFPWLYLMILSLEDGLFEQRVARITEIEALGYRPFGKRFDFTHTVPEILRDYSGKTAEELVPEIRVLAAFRRSGL